MNIIHIKKNDLYNQYCLTWSVDGYAGTLFVRNQLNENNYFTINNHCGILIPKVNDINLEFIKHIIQPVFYEVSKGYGNNKVGTNQIENIIIKIPISRNGDFDIKAQEEIIEKYNLINDLKFKVAEYKQTIKNLKVKIDDELENFKEIPIFEIFKTKKGLSKYTKTYGKQHMGEYPVYSGSNIAPIMFIDTYDYDGDYLSWVVDGFAGYMKVLTGKFSATGHKGIMVLKDSNIDLDYVKFILEPILRESAKGRKGDNRASEYTNVAPKVVENSIIKIPILLDGNFDIETQKSISKKYLMIEQIKASIEEELNKIENLMVNF